MKNLWSEEIASSFTGDVAKRVYTSNLIGQDDRLVLHGGGNTSVKSTVDMEEILFVKGSGWDLITIKEEGFSPVRMHTLLELAQLEHLTDSDMVVRQKAAMLDLSAPNPSVEAILHALIPFKYVDHSHADVVVTISNSVQGKELIADLYGDYLIVPYVMPGFLLAQKIYSMTRNFDWGKCAGIILHNHGIFTFDDDAKISYEKMIDGVNKAEEYLLKNTSLQDSGEVAEDFDFETLKKLISQAKNFDAHLHVNQSQLALNYASQPNLNAFATRGMLTPEHIIRTKRCPLVLNKGQDVAGTIEEYKHDYSNYFDAFSHGELCLNAAPNYAVIAGVGVVSFGKNEKESSIINDIVEHTMEAVLRADQLGGYQSIGLKDSFDMEYWELEQAKLKK